eukprot:2947715-Ditylum_brightwellii.AAC.1
MLVLGQKIGNCGWVESTIQFRDTTLLMTGQMVLYCHWHFFTVGDVGFLMYGADFSHQPELEVVVVQDPPGGKRLVFHCHPFFYGIVATVRKQDLRVGNPPVNGLVLDGGRGAHWDEGNSTC